MSLATALRSWNPRMRSRRRPRNHVHQHSQDGAGDSYIGDLPDFLGKAAEASCVRREVVTAFPAEMVEEDDRGPFDSAEAAATACESWAGADAPPDVQNCMCGALGQEHDIIDSMPPAGVPASEAQGVHGSAAARQSSGPGRRVGSSDLRP